ncbi:MAG TPA: hypothetical protein VD971_11005 [Phycisphaerales bacterium]|nr:hypothetical protein [Phycisphaerales bacterium]
MRVTSLIVLGVTAAAASAQQPATLWNRTLVHAGNAIDARGGIVAVGIGRAPCPGFPGPCPGVGGYVVVDAATGATLRQALPFGGPPNDIALGPADAELLFAGPAQVRRVNDNALLQEFISCCGSSFEAAYSADGSKVFIGTTPGAAPALYVFDRASGQQFNTFALVDFVQAMAVSHTASLLAAADSQNNVLVFSVANPLQEQFVRVFEDPNPWEEDDPYAAGSYILGLAFTPDGTHLATMSMARVNLWRIADGALVRTFESDETYPNQVSGGFYTSVAISPDGSRLAVGGYEVIQDFMEYADHGTATVWDVASGRVVRHYEEGLQKRVTDVDFSDDGSVLFAATAAETDAPFLLAIDLGAEPIACDTIDFNNDGLFPDNQDLVDYLSVFGGGGCSTGNCGDLDFNNDELFPDNADIEAIFRVFGGGPC